MSRFPTLEGGPPVNSNRRNRVEAPLGPIVRETLNAPGVTPAVADTQGLALADQLLNSVGLGARLAESAAVYAGVQNNLDAKAMAEQERKAASANEALQLDIKAREAKAAEMARTDLQLAQGEIAQRKLLAGDGEAGITKSVNDYIASKTQGFSGVEAEAYAKTIRPALTSAFSSQQVRVREEALAETSDSIRRNVIGADNPEAMLDAAKQIGKLNGWSDKQSREYVAMAAMNSGAVTGSTEVVNAAAQVLGPGYEAELARAQAMLLQKKSEELVRERVAFRESSDSLALDPNATFEQRKKYALSFKGRGFDEDVAREVRQIEAEQDRALNAYAKVAQQEAEKQTKQDYQNVVTDAIRSGESWNIWNLPTKAQVGDKEIALNRDEAIDNAARAIEAQIASKYRGQSVPAETMWSEAIDTFGRADVAPPAWKKRMENGAAQATEQALADPATARNAVESFAFYKVARARAPKLAYDLVSDKNARDLFELADAYQKLSPVGTTSKDADRLALLNARRAMSNPVPVSFNALQEQAITQAAQSAAGDGANLGSVRAQIESQAFSYSRLGMNREDAIKRASEQVESSRLDLHGWSVDIGRTSIPKSSVDMLKASVNRLCDDYAKANGERLGIEADQVSIVPSDATGLWHPIDNRFGTLLPGGPWTLDQLIGMEASRVNAEQAAKSAKLRKEATTVSARSAESRMGAGTLTPPGLPGLGMIRAAAANNSIYDQPRLTDGSIK